MPLILHLSDIHLGHAREDSVFDDYKSGIVPLIEKTTRHKLLSNTLRELGQSLQRDGKTLDAIVVTGDLTVANDEAGFESFYRVAQPAWSGLSSTREDCGYTRESRRDLENTSIKQGAVYKLLTLYSL